MKAFKLAVWAAFTFFLLAVFVALIGQNGEPMTVTLFHYTTNEYPKWAVIICCLLIGAALTAVFFVVELIVLETNNIRLRRANKRLERAVIAQNQLGVPGSALGGPSGPAVGLVGPLDEDI